MGRELGWPYRSERYALTSDTLGCILLYRGKLKTEILAHRNLAYRSGRFGRLYHCRSKGGEANGSPG